MKVILNFAVFWGLSSVVFGQALITPEEAIRAALQNHPLSQAAGFEVQAKKYAEKSAFNIPNPEIIAESPTGDFYTIGVSQAFDFPTVYARQKQVAKAETNRAKSAQQVQENDLRYTVRTFYLEAQIITFLSEQWAQRDSFYQSIASTANRQFSAGEIDFLQKTLAENEAGKVHVERLNMEISVVTARKQLASITGLNELLEVQPLQADTVGLALTPGIADNPNMAYAQQSVQVAALQTSLAKSRALPNLSLGYMNQAARNSPIDYRFRASIGVPFWFGQYRAGVNTAKAEQQAAMARSAAQGQEIRQQELRTQAEIDKARAQIQYYEQEALPRSQLLISAAMRMREAGQIDYSTLLRTLDEAYAIRRDFGAQIKVLNAARIQSLYLAGH